MDRLRVRTYNVRFGDAVLVTIPDRQPRGRTTERHVLIDVGNVLSGAGGDDEVFRPILEDVLEETGGRPVDLYVMTHEHMDHCQGLLAGSRVGLEVKAQHAWLTASAAGDYYERFGEARKRFELATRFFDGIERQLAAAPRGLRDAFAARMLNNNHRRTADCVRYLREKVAPEGRVHFVYRGCPLAGTHPFREARFEIWAPEEDTSDYYGRFRPMALGFVDGVAQEALGRRVRPTPPPGVDAAAFENLLERRERGAFDNLFEIDRARNNTSVVFTIEWRGWRLCFAGDAETRSWRTMAKHRVFRPVHVLKVSHHGSHNGTPDEDVLEALLPAQTAAREPRFAVVSTCTGTYPGVPHGPTTDRLRERCEVLTTEGLADGDAWDVMLWDGDAR